MPAYVTAFNEYKCPLCGAIFYPPESEKWAYRARNGQKKELYCSWHCFRKATAKKPKQKPLGKLCKLSEADLVTLHDMLAKGVTPYECAKFFAVDLKTIHRYLDKRPEQFKDVWDQEGYVIA